jgi:hypothetical protein
MRMFNSAVKAAALFISVILFFSCALHSPGDYGTLVIALPGGSGVSASAARAAVSGAYTATLSFRIECSGSGSVSREVRPGEPVSIPLSPGDWVVTVTVLNAADQSIGSGAAPVAIESGKTTVAHIPVSIDTSGNSITQFTVTGPVFAQGLVDTHTITVFLPWGTDTTGMNWMATHTGRSITPAPGTPLDFGSPQTFTVTAENPAAPPKTYTVTVNFEPPPVSGGTASWPADTVWQPYGLSTITQPPGTTVTAAAVSSGVLIVSLQNIDMSALNNLVTQIEALTGGAGTMSGPVMGYTLYERIFTYSGGNLTLTMTHQPDGTLYLTVEPDDTGGSFTWPDTSTWALFNLSGLTQPAGTTVVDVTDADNPYAMLSVTLNNISTAAYGDLLGQITAKLGNPYYSQNPGDGTREDVFTTSAGGSTLMVTLIQDTAYDEVVVTAIKM